MTKNIQDTIGTKLLKALGFGKAEAPTKAKTVKRGRRIRSSLPKSVIRHSAIQKPQCPERPTSWNKQALALLEWKRFEDLCGDYFVAKGHNTKITGNGADGGIDVALYATQETDKLIAVVQCKAWTNRKVGVKDLREFFGVMAAEACPLGIFISRSGFSDDANAFAADKAIKMVDSEKLLALILGLPDTQQAKLLEQTFSGDFHTPSCPKCAIKLSWRSSQKGSQPGKAFWGCGNFPKCRYTLQIANA